MGSTGLSIISEKSPGSFGRKLLSINEEDEEEKDITSESFAFDNMVYNLQGNMDFLNILQLLQTGSVDQQRIVRRKLYEGF